MNLSRQLTALIVTTTLNQEKILKKQNTQHLTQTNWT